MMTNFSKEPLHIPGIFTPEQLEPLLLYGNQILEKQRWTNIAVNCREVTKLGLSVEYLKQVNAAIVSVEQDTDLLPEACDRVREFAQEFTDTPDRYTTLGFNFYFGINSIIKQRKHVNKRPSECMTLAGVGGVMLDGSTAIDSNPGDWFTAGTAKHAGFGIGNPEEPRISAYFY